jgi:predicted Zn-dependent peptidase
MLKSVDAITLDDLKAMHNRIYQPGDAVIFAAGSMSADSFKSSLEGTLGGWKQTREEFAPNKPKYVDPARKPLRVYIVEKPGAVQTDVRFILPAPTAHDPRYLKLDAIGTLFGGTFTSRLNRNLRETHGYTYGAGAAYALEPSTGYFEASAAVRTNVTGASLREFLKEFASIRTGNITADEVQKSTQAMRTSRIDSATSLENLLGTAAGMYMEGRSYTDLGKELQEISTMTPAQLNALVKSAIPLENGALILVGDKAQILAQYKGLGLPTPTIVVAQ